MIYLPDGYGYEQDEAGKLRGLAAETNEMGGIPCLSESISRR